MRRAAHREQMRRRAGVVAAVQAGKVVNDACGQKASEADAKLMQLQRRAAFFLRSSAVLLLMSLVTRRLRWGMVQD